jgi:hypothetical protein
MPKGREPGVSEKSAIFEFIDELTGVGTANLYVVYPKCVELRNVCTKFVGLLGAAARSGKVSDWIGPAAVESLQRKTIDCAAQLKVLDILAQKPEMDAFEKSEESLTFRTDYTMLYRQIKNSDLIATLLEVSAQMAPLLAVDFEVPLKDALAQVGGDMYPLVINMQLRDSWNELRAFLREKPKQAESVWAEHLRRMLRCGKQLLAVLDKPDFDAQAVGRGVTEALTHLPPNLMRSCGNVIDMIRQSSDLFETNAGKYQREIERTDSPMIILELYAKDLQEEVNKKNDKSLKIGLSQIMRYIRQQTALYTAQNGKAGLAGRAMSAVNTLISKEIETIDEQRVIETARERGAAAAERLRAELAECDKAELDEVAVLAVQAKDASAEERAAADAAWSIDDAMAFLNGDTKVPPGERSKPAGSGAPAAKVQASKTPSKSGKKHPKKGSKKK